MADIGTNVARVRARIAESALRSGRRPEDVTLVGVTKTIGLDRVREVVACGVHELGENRVQEARAKVPQVTGVTWHLVGSLQRNKAREALRLFEVIHSVDSLALAEELSRRGAEPGATRPPLLAPGALPGHASDPKAGAGRGPVEILVQVNISGEPQKHGVDPEDTPRLIAQVLPLAGLKVRGLMGMAPLVDNPDEARPYFRRLREIRDRAAEALPGSGAIDLSMGMTDDFEVAIEEGATMVRIGRALFG
jgi:PLP dependent protein